MIDNNQEDFTAQFIHLNPSTIIMFPTLSYLQEIQVGTHVSIFSFPLLYACGHLLSLIKNQDPLLS